MSNKVWYDMFIAFTYDLINLPIIKFSTYICITEDVTEQLYLLSH